jgi:SNF2 family DNA or RNA helicase
MCLLDEMGWGGCLADDMGLGKTLQTITFLQYLVSEYRDETHLVICPTSLLYNWEAELKKFAPGLGWHIHYGADRVLDEEVFRSGRLIITSYGMVRNDIQHFAACKFGYIILDESQAIKNPGSQVRKAVQQLTARNRLALSGTPVQNNTFDLYAQMDFLNPGMLGSQDFFRMEFATPIDKNGDKEASARLRKLVYPFILRRTKEQVARDLPDKTEMILWCEMGTEQRKIYDSFKDHYRESILEHIAEDGVGRSSIYILEGLTKLRQICDSPAILREETPYPNSSAKLDELIREIEENTGHHKALVFSQFTSMLELIRTALAERGIPYLYLDGSVSAEDRRLSVQQFQEEEDTRVFLISLKAGGVGLTLTAADYVYLVDPWWNPAAEQQAIDRSHRIGQVKKVFAYRMICKDTVEEKILQLQEKKRQLTADLVGDEGGFVKKLTQEDVAYLFS